VHLVARGTGEAQILDRLKARIARAQSALGAPDPFGTDEKLIARSVVTREWSSIPDADPADPSPPSEPAMNGVDVVAPDLGAAGCAEADRLRVARAFSGKRDQAILASLEGDGPWILSASHRRRLREAIGSKTLLVWRVTLENRSGQVLASRLVPMMVNGIVEASTRTSMKGLIRSVAEGFASRVDLSCRDWQVGAAAAISAYMSTRLARERALAGKLPRTELSAFQPGLFDRRADRDHAAQMALLADLQREDARRIAALERAAEVVCTPIQLLLAVMP
jgi:hypothetical protein